MARRLEQRDDFSASGLVEEGAVFSTSKQGEADTIWMLTRHDPAAYAAEFARFTPRSRTCLLRIAVSAAGQNRSHFDISYASTSLTQAGRQFLDGWTEKEFHGAMQFWERSMNHFLQTGERLARAGGGAA